jgi:hypothetical protein
MLCFAAIGEADKQKGRGIAAPALFSLSARLDKQEIG